MKESAKGEAGRKAARGQMWLYLPGIVREALYDTVIGAGLACVDEVLEMERVALCGERYEHLADRQALRDHGFSDADIFDIAEVAGFFNMTNRVAHGVDMMPNPEYHAMAR